MVHILNQYFDRIYCVTCYNFTDRHELVRKQLEGIDFEWVFGPPAETMKPIGSRTPTETSGILGHLAAVWNARLRGYKKIAIWEDDGVLTASEEEMKLFFDEVPDNWDFLYMANGSWNAGIWDDWKNWCRPHSEHVNKIYWGTGCSFNGIQSHVFDAFEKEELSGELPIDFVYYKLFKDGNNSYCPSKKFFCDPLSAPHESVRDRFDLSKFIPSQVLHSF